MQSVCATRDLRKQRSAGLYRQIIEMPFYRASPDGWTLQRFEQPDSFDQIPSQLRAFSTSPTVRSQRLPGKKFGTLANGGIVLYDRYDWGMQADQWPSLVADAAAALVLPTTL
jgi:hypothetical protein